MFPNDLVFGPGPSGSFTEDGLGRMEVFDVDTDGLPLYSGDDAA